MTPQFVFNPIIGMSAENTQSIYRSPFRGGGDFLFFFVITTADITIVALL